jgi:hypothetical protein
MQKAGGKVAAAPSWARFVYLAGLAGIVALCVSGNALAQGVVAYSNLGTGSSIYSAQGDLAGWCVSGKAECGAGIGPAFSFTHGNSAYFTQLRIPLEYLSGTNSVMVYLMSDSIGSPGAILQSWNVTNLPQKPPCCALQTLQGNGTIALGSGTPYWVAVLPSAADTNALWLPNPTGATQNPFFTSGAGWYPFPISPIQLTGAFEVLGKRICIPEPSGPLGLFDDQWCGCGPYGPGGPYNPTNSYCVQGAIVPLGCGVCPPGAFGPGGIICMGSYCDSGVTVLNGDKFCPPGAFGPGGSYVPSLAFCSSGAIVPNSDSLCLPGSFGPGGIYDPKVSFCSSGLVLPLGTFPPVVSVVATTGSGLTYSRVSQTFNGTATIRNIGKISISGTLRILFKGLPANVTLVNASGTLSGSPYLALPATLAPGQSVTITVQFEDPSNTTINFTPVIYLGS